MMKLKPSWTVRQKQFVSHFETYSKFLKANRRSKLTLIRF